MDADLKKPSFPMALASGLVVAVFGSSGAYLFTDARAEISVLKSQVVDLDEDLNRQRLETMKLRNELLNFLRVEANRK